MSLSDTTAIIGGSQGFRVLDGAVPLETLGPVATPFGESAPLHRIWTDAGTVLFLSRHGETGYHVSAPFVNYRANIWALKELGVERIIAWSGPGAIDPSLPIGDVLVPGDLIDETRSRPSTFYEGTGLGFIRQNPVFCPEISRVLTEAIFADQGHCRTDDVYVCTEGPRLETRAEIRKFAGYGASLVGMTLVPEAFLAKELEMCYCPVCYVTNYAEGVLNRGYSTGELFEGLLSDDERVLVDRAVQKLPVIAMRALSSLSKDRRCPCAVSMQRYRNRGDIGEDWRSWIKT